MAFKTRAAHLVVTASVAAVLATSVAGCSNIRSRDTVGSIGSAIRYSDDPGRMAKFPGQFGSALPGKPE
jgi:hypothetical protein